MRTLALAVLMIFASTAWVHSEESKPDPRRLLPLAFKTSKDPAIQQYEYYDFMWRSFVALNWPNVPIRIENRPDGPVIASGYRGKPDGNRSINDMSGKGRLPLTVWETYKEPFEVFPKPELWDKLARWNIPRGLPGGLHVDASARRLLQFPGRLTGYAPDINQPYFYDYATGPLIDQHGNYVRYEVAVNEAFFTYVRHFGYFDADAQKQAVSNYLAGDRGANGFVRPPFGNPAELENGGYLSGLPGFAKQGMIDVKAAWKVLEPDKGERPERYLHRRIIVDKEGTEQFMGLVALHILRYTPNGYDSKNGVAGSFVAATFEQVDNVDTKFAPYPGLKPSFNSGKQRNPQQAKYGFEGEIPPQVIQPDPIPVDIYRVTGLPPLVKAANERYQAELNGSVFRYYRLIGTQNKHPGTVQFKPEFFRRFNGHEGPTTGVYTNTNNLINAALESYTQKNFSCIGCHVRARPQGVPEKAFEEDHFKILTFLLQSAQAQRSPK